MKNLVLSLTVICLLLGFGNANSQKITNISAPDEVSPGQTSKVTVEYSVKEPREIIVSVQENGGKWKGYAWVTVKVKAGEGKVDVDVPVSSEIPLAIDAYKIGVTLVPVGSGYPNRLDERSKANVDAVATNSPTENKTTEVKNKKATKKNKKAAAENKTATTDDIISITAPDQVSPGEKIKVTIEYGASESRDILINLTLNKEPWTNYGSTKIKVGAGSGTKDIELTVSKDIPLATDAYSLAVAIVPVDGNWKSRLDNIIKGKLDAVAATSGKKKRK